MYRSMYYPGFEAGSRGLEADFGAAMTFVLLASSFTMAMSVHAAHAGKRGELGAPLGRFVEERRQGRSEGLSGAGLLNELGDGGLADC